MVAKFTDISPLIAGHEGYFNQLSNIGIDHQKRVTEYQNRWKFYEGYHWQVEDARNVTGNYIKLLVDTKIEFFTKNGFPKISIPEDPMSAASESIDRAFIKSYLDDSWDRNKGNIWLNKATQIGSVAGDVFVRVGWEKDRDGEYFPMANIIQPQFVFPEFNVLHPDIMVQCHIIWPNVIRTRRETAKRRPWGLGFHNDRVEWMRETWTLDEVRTYKDDDLINVEENVLGEIPIVHIKNSIDGNSHYGKSDIDTLISPQKAFNESLTDINDIIEYQGSPITHVKGGKLNNVERGPDKVWSTSSDVEIRNIGLDSDLKANNDFVDRLRDTMLDLSSVPEQAINPSKNISNTPGVALHMTYLPLITNRSMKVLTYGEGIVEINRFMLRVAEIGDEEFGRMFSRVGRGKYRTTLNFGEPLPRDEMHQNENKRTRLELGLTTRKRILMEEGVGEADASTIVQEADEESTLRASIKSSNDSKNPEQDIFGKRKRPDPVIQGDKVSLNASK